VAIGLRILLLAIPLAVGAQSPDPAWAPLNQAYEALREKRYEEAIRNFEAARAITPERADIYKNLGYTLLKIGETEAARDRFGDAMRLDPGDTHIALEYAYLCYETKQQAVARRVFERVQQQGNPLASAAFRNIDQELAAGIARWSLAVQLSPDNFSGHQELARLAEQRNDLELSARHYEKCWQLRPDLPELLVDLGRVWQQLGRTAQSNAALLAASRGTQARPAEAARELLPSRYPFVYEFEAALQMDSGNTNLRRELAYLHLEMGHKMEAEREFRCVVDAQPQDTLSAAQLGFLLLGRNDVTTAMPLLERVLASGDDEVADRVREALKMPRMLKKRSDTTRTSPDPKLLAQKSLDAGYLKDALKYLRIAHEHDPADFNVMLKLGWTHNMLKDDRSALEWFRLASKSPDPNTAVEAKKAYNNLRPAFTRWSTSGWMLPLYSSRWKDTFTYAQLKSEYKVPGTSLRAYASARFSGDIRGSITPANSSLPMYLSESAVVLGGGLAATPWRGITLWAEAGSAVQYVDRNNSRTQPDVRGGISIARTLGRSLVATQSGVFLDTTADLLYLSRFERDTILYWQNRTGYTFAPARLQVYWNTNLVKDIRNLYWANTIEQGPGMRFRFKLLPASMFFMLDAVNGRYTVNDGNPHGPVFRDFRAGIWYAFTR
jgi:Tfp pilus assembly protein PilF